MIAGLHYGELHWWYCDICGDEGESDSEAGAVRQAENHECEAYE